MRVILLCDIRGVGRKNEVKEVKDGYARNVLLPKKLVAAATPEVLLRLEFTNKKLAEDREKNLQKISEDVEQLKNIVLEFNVRANKQGEIFGSVSAKDIERLLYEKGFKTAKAILEKPIKHLGESLIEISLEDGIKTMVKIKVIAKP